MRTLLEEIIAVGCSILEAEGSPRHHAGSGAPGGRAGMSRYKRVRDRHALLDLIADATVDHLTAWTQRRRPLATIARIYRTFAQESRGNG